MRKNLPAKRTKPWPTTPTGRLKTDADTLAATAELVEAGLSGAKLIERVEVVRKRIRAAYEAVVDSESISALEAESALIPG